MANPRLIKKRVSSIKNIGKITKALEMVSASKVQKAQDKAQSAKPYAGLIYELVGKLAEDTEVANIPLMRKPANVKSELYILVSTNRGLAGSLNTNLFKNVASFLQNNSKTTSRFFVTVGKKGRSFADANGKLVADFSEDADMGSVVSAMVKLITDGFTDESYDAVFIAYSDFVTALSQEPTVKQILPISEASIKKDLEDSHFDLVGKGGGKDKSAFGGYSFEPDATTVLTNLLPFYLEVQVAEALYEAEASEHSSRMIAMKNASDNAGELSESLQLEYNKARQQIITTEISDITTAQAAVVKMN